MLILYHIIYHPIEFAGISTFESHRKPYFTAFREVCVDLRKWIDIYWRLLYTGFAAERANDLNGGVNDMTRNIVIKLRSVNVMSFRRRIRL